MTLKRHFLREKRPEIKAVETARLTISLHPGQYFCVTPKAYEIWQDEPVLMLVRRIPRKSVLWVHER